MKKAIGILQIVSGAALLAAGVLTIVEGSARRSARFGMEGEFVLSREDAALWERLSRFWADVARQDAAALREWFAPEAEVYWHCTDERFTAEEYIRANCEYPGDWEGAVERAEWTEDGCVSVAAVWPKDRSARFHAVFFFRSLGAGSPA